MRRSREHTQNYLIKVEMAEDLPLIYADATLMEHVVLNLLDNAVKYSVEGSKIELQTALGANEVIVIVKDCGVGFKEADLPHLFDKFYRAGNTEKISGTGLGLAICKGIVDAHHGRIWAELRPDGGSIFAFALPVTLPEEKAGGKMTESALRVLVIDDEPAIKKLLKISMQAYGYELGEAAAGQEGLLMAASFRPDIILVDLGLPDMDGKAVVKALREWSETPIIVLTAREQEQEKIAALDAGADDYVTKPFGMGELMARMRVCLRRSGNKEGEPLPTCGGLQLNLLEHRVVVEGHEVKLTPTEYELLKVMLKYAGRVLTHKQLLKAVWGNEYDTDTHYIRIYMRQLRRKIEPDPAQPKYLITEAGIGYRLLGGE
ncbi:MAG: response regulator [Acidaminococcaceae bacterium]|nr:response regulator [Acidaminococcaceae bacterium]